MSDYRNKPFAAWQILLLFIAVLSCTLLGILQISSIGTSALILLILTVTLGFFLVIILWRERSMFFSEKYESEEKFRKLFDESPFCMLMADKDLKIIKANKPFCQMIDYPEEQLKMMTFRNFTDERHIKEDENGLARLSAQEIPVYHTEKQYIKRDGTTIWGSTTISSVRNTKGELLSFIAMVEDITARKNAETKLEKSLSILRATIESTADGLLVVDLKGNVVQYNRKFSEMWRIPGHLLDTMDDSQLLMFVKDQLKNPERFLEDVRLLYESKTHEVTNDVIEFSDGRFFERFSQPQVINDVIVGRVWSFRDITGMKKAEKELIDAKEKAEEGDRLKTAFLHNVSHEIRTPMNAIIGFSTLLNEKGISEQERLQYAGIISDSSNQLLAIINDIVDTANIESGQVKVNLTEMNLNLMLKNLNEQFSYKKEKIIIDLKMELSDENAWIITDNTKIVQVLSNLISNALKFTREGRIEVAYNVKGDMLEFAVSDTGIGIPEEHLSRIFTRFYQVEMTGTRQYGGTGLGLSICKAYINLLGGNIWVESKPGNGTIFRFTVPYKRRG
jgi:PAS domain S-box-containing protein